MLPIKRNLALDTERWSFPGNYFPFLSPERVHSLFIFFTSGLCPSWFSWYKTVLTYLNCFAIPLMPKGDHCEYGCVEWRKVTDIWLWPTEPSCMTKLISLTTFYRLQVACVCNNVWMIAMFSAINRMEFFKFQIILFNVKLYDCRIKSYNLQLLEFITCQFINIIDRHIFFYFSFMSHWHMNH